MTNGVGAKTLLVTLSAATMHHDGSPFLVEPAEAISDAARRDAVVGEVGVDRDGRRIVEVVVQGWRFECLVEDAERAALRSRASRPRAAADSSGGPLEIRAIIPGRIAAVSVVAGDPVLAGQSILVVEAMKMQNELRAPRDGKVARVAVASGQTIEIGDLLVVLA